VQELKDLMIDRVDGVDRPATGRNFILAKSEDGGQPVETEERSSIWSDVFKIGSTRSFDQAPESGVKVADEGSDAMGREYDDQAYNALGGLNQRQPETDPIPAAGLLVDSRETPNSGVKFPVSTGGRLVKPMEPYANKEDVQPGDVVRPTSLPGGMRVMSPSASGIAEPLNFDPPAPATVVKRRGLFASILGKRGDSADGYLG
jgi:hypothetical protein